MLVLVVVFVFVSETILPFTDHLRQDALAGDGEQTVRFFQDEEEERSPAPQQPDHSVTDLKYRLIEYFGGVLVGEPVVVPDHVRREQARSAFATIRQDEEEFQAILDQLSLERGSELTEDQQLLVFEEKRKLNAVLLEPTESGYSFRMMVRDGGNPYEMMVRDAGNPYEITGAVDQTAKITVLTREPALLPR